jgi:hypothetical protein
MNARHDESRDTAATEPLAGPPGGGAAHIRLPKSPKHGAQRDPAFTATLVRRDTLKVLRKLQKSTPKPRLDLKFLSEACHQLALEIGPEEVVKRAYALWQQRASC